MQWFITNSGCFQHCCCQMLGFGFHDFDTLLTLRFILYPSQPAPRDQISPTMHLSCLTRTHTISVHTQQMSIVVFSFKKAPLNNGVSEERGERGMCWVLSGVWSQGERGPTGPPGIQGETGIGLPGPKVKLSSEYSCFPSAYVCCLHFLGFVLFNIISAQSAGWHWIPRPAWSTWAYWNRWTRSSCEFNVVFLSWSASFTLHRLDDLSTPLTFIYRDLKDRKVFRVVKDLQVKACLDPR